MADEPASSPPPPLPESDQELLAQCRVETFRSGGPGGQHQNRTESGVRLVHLPTGISASSRSARSQHRNRTLALERLRRKLEAARQRPAPRVRTTPPPGERERRLQEKRRRGEVKKLRDKPREEDG